MHAAQIVTYSTFGAKQAVRDVFKRFGLPEYELTNITKKIRFGDSLASAYEKKYGLSPDYQQQARVPKGL